MYEKGYFFKNNEIYKQYSSFFYLLNKKKIYIYLYFLTASINILCLLINIKFLLKKNINFFYLLKNCDFFSLGISIKGYRTIVDFLNKKFFINKNQSVMKKKKNISISIVDFLDCMKDNNMNYLLNLLRDDFVIDFNNTYPDYLLYDVFGCEHLNQKYNNSIKIAYYSENMIPDFNQADYALSQAHFNYLDRYYKYPSITWRFSMNNIMAIKKTRNNIKNRKKFCAAVISNNASFANFRLHFTLIF